MLCIERGMVDRLNAIDERITFATLPAFAAVEPGELAATVKIIPFAVPAGFVARALVAIARPPVRVAPFLPMRVAVISTLLPGLKDSVVAKTLRVLAVLTRRSA